MEQRRSHYHLRYQIVPGRSEEQGVDELIDLCQKAQVEEVVLFVAAEEWNDGFLTEAELERWLGTVRRAKEAFEAAGLTVSLNLWYSILHCERGRQLHAGQRFDRMVSPLGRESSVIASYACPQWRAHLSRVFGRFASLGFRVLWIEDDFRLRNHDPLDWGGDFSPAMIERFEQKIGRQTHREEILRALLRPGEPHPWRRLWFETWNGALVEACEALRHEVAARTGERGMLGLMSGPIDYHWVEGRDWPGLLAAISIDGRAAHRPGYVNWGFEASGLAQAMTALDMQRRIRQPGVAVEPEVELGGDYGVYGKARSYAWWHMAVAQLFGCDALLLNLFSMAGNPPSLEDGDAVGWLLRESRPCLDWLARHFVPSDRTSGVGVLWSLDAAYHVRTTAGQVDAEVSWDSGNLRAGHPMDQLDLKVPAGAVLLSRMGIAAQMEPAAVNLLFGSAAWALGEADLLGLLANGLWLDGEAAQILQQRGLGKHLGVEHEGWLRRDDLPYSLEQVEEPAPGVPQGYLMRRDGFSQVSRLAACPEAAVWTSLLDSQGKALAPALTVFANELGGSVAVSALPLQAEGRANYLAKRPLKALVENLLRRLGGAAEEPVTADGPGPLLPLDFRGNSQRVVVQNGGLDPVAPVVRVGGTCRLREAVLLAPLATPAPVPAQTELVDGRLMVRLQQDVPYLGMVVLFLDREPGGA